MKKISNLLLLTIMLLVSTSCSAQSKLFREATSMKGVQTVYVSKALCRMGMNVADLGDLQEGIKQLDEVEVISCDNKSTVSKLSKKCEEIIDTTGAEVLLSTNEDDESTTMFGIPSAEPGYLKSLFVITRDKDDFNLVHISGLFNLDKIIASQTNKSDKDDSDDE